MTEFQGKRIVVTGAASGIGQAVAEQFLSSGAEVYSLDRNEPSAAVTAHVEVDLANPQSIDDALEQLDGTFDVLVNVAGIPGTAPGDVVFAVNALAVRHLTDAMSRRLARGGSAIVVSSTAGFGWPQRLPVIRELLDTKSFEDGAAWFKEHPQQDNAYNFSKEVATVYTMRKALEFSHRGLRINAVLPGPVETPILADFEETMGKDTLDGAKALVGRHAVPMDIADVVLLLASDSARWVNGQTISVDGGAMAAVACGLIPAPQMR